MKSDYWNVSNEQVIEKTGKNIAYWLKVLSDHKAETRKSNDVIAFLMTNHALPRYWARTLLTRYHKERD